MSLIYISDTNIWIDFRNAGLLEHMFRLPFTLCCTDFVMHELEDFPHDELLARGLVVESFDEGGVQKLLTLKVEHNNSSLADVSCYLLAQATGRPLLTGDGSSVARPFGTDCKCMVRFGYSTSWSNIKSSIIPLQQQH